ncbi:MAG: pseudaminic acid synthase [Candidatus Komeilibacteria bacterium RIFCSPLOWO2_01_FULL_52_15]|uniref:Pseudaminic acid synthase n=2 Tax=Candidatus Komeiliibacteriota TaxID=1817908 RepID=A0A1G2BPU0_9BACT|nr:MAG: pseudaminic acid synthase [Candidatus Komeilibacteria bacterium RIFCSPHIGHO2_01_FULL_52_14]OGY91132.1 MAG: pseudaminic acid synthase [Candidatus Komeilibacteria bacterium RIFCSPLOWO2_01_FULL_52_15]
MKTPQFSISTPKGQRPIGFGHPCFIVAEVSCNHMQRREKAEKIIRIAAESGADAVKLQTFTPDTITLHSDTEYFLVGGKDNPDSWKQKTLYDLYQTAFMPWEWQAELKELAEKLGLVFFSSPFDETAVDFLETLHVVLYKIASYEMTHIPLLKKVASTGKPVIMSVGFNSLDEAEESVRALRKNNCNDIALLHCLNTYADEAEPQNANLIMIRELADHFNVVSGFSDNNGGIAYAILAAAAGASIIEKHVIESRTDKSFDQRFSIDANQLKEMVDTIRKNEKAMGKVHYGPVNEAEKYNLRFRRSIFAAKEIRKGETFTSANIRVVRPAFGMQPKFYESVIGKIAKRDIKFGTPIAKDCIT